MRGESHSVDQLYFQIGLLMDLYRRIAFNMGLSESAFWILYVLSTAEKALSQSEVAAILSVSKQTVNSSVKCLVQGELVSLHYAPETTRTKIVKLTECGRLAIQKVIVPLRQTEEYIFHEMGTEAEMFREFIANLCVALNKFAESCTSADISDFIS